MQQRRQDQPPELAKEIRRRTVLTRQASQYGRPDLIYSCIQSLARRTPLQCSNKSSLATHQWTRKQGQLRPEPSSEGTERAMAWCDTPSKRSVSRSVSTTAFSFDTYSLVRRHLHECADGNRPKHEARFLSAVVDVHTPASIVVDLAAAQ